MYFFFSVTQTPRVRNAFTPSPNYFPFLSFSPLWSALREKWNEKATKNRNRGTRFSRNRIGICWISRLLFCIFFFSFFYLHTFLPVCTMVPPWRLASSWFSFRSCYPLSKYNVVVQSLCNISSFVLSTTLVPGRCQYQLPPKIRA